MQRGYCVKTSHARQAERLWLPEALPAHPQLNLPKHGSPRQKKVQRRIWQIQGRHTTQATEGGVIPVLPSAAPSARQVPPRQSVVALLAAHRQQSPPPRHPEHQHHQQPQSPLLPPQRHAPSPTASPRPTSPRRTRPSSASAAPETGVMPDEELVRQDLTQKPPDPLAYETASRPLGPAANGRAKSPGPFLEGGVGLASQRGHTIVPTRASSSSRHILARSGRLRNEGSTFANCTPAPSPRPPEGRL